MPFETESKDMDTLRLCLRHAFCSVDHSENNIENVLDNTFSVEHNSFGKVHEYELKPGGNEIKVTEENKREYVK